MSASALPAQPFRPRDVFSPDELAALTRRSDLAGIAVTAGLWASIAACFALLAWFPNTLVFVLVVVLLGGRQHALAVLGHEAAHRTLCRNERLGDFLGDWLGARWVWQDVPRYRAHHLRHHATTGSDADPDISLATPYPGSRRALRKRVVRDLVGLTGLRRLAAQFLMDIGVFRYTVAAEVERLPQDGRRWHDYLRSGVRHMSGFVLTNLLMLAVLMALGIGWTYLAWAVAYLTTFSLFIRLRAIAEHAGMSRHPDVRRNTRSTRAGWLARLTLAPLNVHYHQDHHLMAAVPCYRLPKLHRLLRERGAVVAPPSYPDVWRAVTAGAAR